MPRIHINVSDDVLAKVNAHCARTMSVRNRFIVRGIEMALQVHDGDKVFGTQAANDPAPAPASAIMAASFDDPAPTNGEPVACVLRGPVPWFALEDVCKLLGIETAALMLEIDPADDVLQYAGRSWVDERGVAEARALSTNAEASDILGDFVKAKLPA